MWPKHSTNSSYQHIGQNRSSFYLKMKIWIFNVDGEMKLVGGAKIPRMDTQWNQTKKLYNIISCKLPFFCGVGEWSGNHCQSQWAFHFSWNIQFVYKYWDFLNVKMHNISVLNELKTPISYWFKYQEKSPLSLSGSLYILISYWFKYRFIGIIVHSISEGTVHGIILPLACSYIL